MEIIMDCFKCGGSGKVEEKETCFACHGRGNDLRPDPFGGGAFFKCRKCDGNGFTYVKKECPLCDGTGKVGGKKR